jgi:drug/metabolite transporter (DMT)-like permease
LIPIITILAGILVLHETLSIRQIVGGAAVMLGVVLVVGIRSAKNKNANKKHTS